ncbi:MAG TPA: hypothetical protein VLI72_12845 [Methylibium sp.]|nr:hypothetical protein [Methylibium sp.]
MSMRTDPHRPIGWSTLLVGAGVGLAAAWASTLARPLPPLGAAGRVGMPLCAPGERPGAAGRDDGVRTPDGLAISVRTPSDYDATHGYPLLVVYPPAGNSRVDSERFYGLTEEATRRGYVLAYSAAVSLSRRALALQQRVAETVASRWCIDTARLAFIGHSDGASVAQGVLLRGDAKALRPGHVLASAAGIRGADLQSERCPRPTRLTIVHGSRDELFPGYGRETARWWAGCFACAAAGRLDGQLAADTCIDLGPCREGGGVRYCEASEPHTRWPGVARHPFPYLGIAPGQGPFAPSLVSRRS